MGHTFPPDDDPSVGALDNEGRNSGRPFTAAAAALGRTLIRLSAVGRECPIPGLLEIKLGGIKLHRGDNRRSCGNTRSGDVGRRKDPASRPGTCGRIGEQLGINLETLRG